jgi:hypothetical protein
LPRSGHFPEEVDFLLRKGSPVFREDIEYTISSLQFSIHPYGEKLSPSPRQKKGLEEGLRILREHVKEMKHLGWARKPEEAATQSTIPIELYDVIDVLLPKPLRFSIFNNLRGGQNAFLE